MTPVIPTAWPGFFYAGDTVKVYRSFADYPASEGWALTAYFTGPAATVTVTGVADVDRWLVTLNATNSALVGTGTLRVIEKVSKSGEVFTVGQHIIESRFNPATVAAGGTQTHAEKTLAVIEAALNGRMTSDIAEYSIGGRAVKKIPINELAQMRGYYAAMVERQRTGKLGRTIAVEFPS